MGYLSLHRAPGISNREFFADALGSSAKILDCASVANREFYAAIEHDGHVCAYVALFQWTRDHHNFTYKDMSEFDGPGATRCPERILKLLSPLDENSPCGDSGREWAADWRDHCRAYNARRAKAAAVKRGAFVRFAQPFTFVDDVSEAEFRFVSHSKFYRECDGRLVRISNWRQSDFSVVSGASSSVQELV